ncbi:cold shock domain-containing protein [Streptomyces sp. NBC_01239]|uniref:cold-shock protein n=1 Tax=Streptomyces sp. NBC_01239 TaxID=2903792 RepID=UPI00225A9AE5|nr:cold shock domain-containing protein [Streptomyces sp. NBC_01239]MCX4815653.1 cold shock domain-containing protein [Streptomyces sp. NBC_01239]
MGSGTVKTYMADRKLGFITPDSGGDDVTFFHEDVVGFTDPAEGARVQFEITQGPRVVNVVVAEN